MQDITNDSEKKEFDVDDVLNAGFDQQEKSKISPKIQNGKIFFKILFSTVDLMNTNNARNLEHLRP